MLEKTNRGGEAALKKAEGPEADDEDLMTDHSNPSMLNLRLNVTAPMTARRRITTSREAATTRKSTAVPAPWTTLDVLT